MFIFNRFHFFFNFAELLNGHELGGQDGDRRREVRRGQERFGHNVGQQRPVRQRRAIVQTGQQHEPAAEHELRAHRRGCVHRRRRSHVNDIVAVM